MGYIRHHAIIVTGGDWQKEFEPTYKEAEKLFKQISPIIESPINGYRSFFVAPDGSKEGWVASDKGDADRDKFKEILRKSHLDWVEIQYGDDERITKIINHSDEYDEYEE